MAECDVTFRVWFATWKCKFQGSVQVDEDDWTRLQKVSRGQFDASGPGR